MEFVFTVRRETAPPDFIFMGIDQWKKEKVGHSVGFFHKCQIVGIGVG